MVGTDNGRHRIRESHALQNFRPDDGVDLYPLKLLGRQLARLVEDVLGYSQLADVVQQGGGTESLRFLLAQPQFPGYCHGHAWHPLEVVVGGFILGLDRQGQSLESAKVQSGDQFGVFLCFLQAEYPQSA